MLESPPAALPVQSPALPSLKQCSDETLTHPLLGLLHKSIYRQHAPNPDCFFASCKTALVFPGRQQVSSAALRQAAPRASDAGSTGGRAQVQPPFCEPCSKSS